MRVTRPPLEKYCAFCGKAFEEPLNHWPKFCDCQQPTFRNPIPVVCTVLPVLTQQHAHPGVLLIRRAIQPCKGQLALPGGYMELDETWQQAAKRECMEETGIDCTIVEDAVFYMGSNPKLDRLLIFALAEPMHQSQLPETISNDEVSGYVLAHSPMALAFSVHEIVLNLFFKRQQQG